VLQIRQKNDLFSRLLTNMVQAKSTGGTGSLTNIFDVTYFFFNYCRTFHRPQLVIPFTFYQCWKYFFLKNRWSRATVRDH